MRRWFDDVFARGDLAAIDEIVAPEFVAHAPGEGPEARGRETFKAWLQRYRASFTDPEWTVHEIIAEGDRVVARYSGRTTYRGGLLGIPGGGQRIVETGILIFRLAEGKIAELWPEMADLQVLMQLGAIVRPGAAAREGTRPE